MRKYFAILVICLLGLLIYSNSFDGSYHFDDFGYVYANEAIKDLSNVKAIWKSLTYPIRFVTFYTFALNYHFHQLDVVGYHVVNFLIHLITSVLVWWFVLLLLSTPVGRKQKISQAKEMLALLTALIFLTHPIQTQAVTYISQRFASLATLFYIGSLCFYLKARVTGNHKGYFVGSAVMALLGMFTKEIVLTLPFMILITEVLFFQTKKSVFFNWKVFLVFGIFISVIPAAYQFNVPTVYMQETLPSDSHLGDELTNTRYLLTQFRVVTTYIRLLFFPLNQNLDYDYPLSYNFFDPTTFICFVFLSAIVGLAFFIRKKQVLIAYGIFWFFITLSVESSFILIRNVIFEHRLYLPSIGFSLALCVTLFNLFHKDQKKWVATILSMVLVCSFLTFQRNKVWKDEVALWSDVIKKAPNKSRAYLNIGNAYFQVGQYKNALKFYMAGIHVNPNDHKIFNSVGTLLHNQKQYDKALYFFKRALAIHPRYYETMINRGNTYGKLGLFDLAINDYNQALPHSQNKVAVYLNRANKYVQLGKLDLAMSDYNSAAEVSPNFPRVYQNRGNLFEIQGQLKKAMADYDKALGLGYEHKTLFLTRGNTLMKMGQYPFAKAEFTKALEIDPNYVPALLNRAQIYAVSGQFQKALMDYNHLLNITPNNGVAYYNRSMIYRKQQDYPKALADVKKAQELGQEINADYLQGLLSEMHSL